MEVLVHVVKKENLVYKETEGRLAKMAKMAMQVKKVLLVVWVSKVFKENLDLKETPEIKETMV